MAADHDGNSPLHYLAQCYNVEINNYQAAFQLPLKHHDLDWIGLPSCAQHTKTRQWSCNLNKVALKRSTKRL